MFFSFYLASHCIYFHFKRSKYIVFLITSRDFIRLKKIQFICDHYFYTKYNWQHWKVNKDFTNIQNVSSLRDWKLERLTFPISLLPRLSSSKLLSKLTSLSRFPLIIQTFQKFIFKRLEFLFIAHLLFPETKSSIFLFKCYLNINDVVFK